MKPKLPKRSESSVLSSVREYLKARGILHFRMQVGAMKNPRGQHVAFGHPGQADILFTICTRFVMPPPGRCLPLTIVVWVETKSSMGKQSEDQKRFQKMVEMEGHAYLLVRSAAELDEWMRKTS